MTIEKAMELQEKLIDKLKKKLTRKEQLILREIINLEYVLTMTEEGHECEIRDYEQLT